jgi:hypothetical protein
VFSSSVVGQLLTWRTSSLCSMPHVLRRGRYLKALHDKERADNHHTTLLLNCYTKLKDDKMMDEFIMGPVALYKRNSSLAVVVFPRSLQHIVRYSGCLATFVPLFDLLVTTEVGLAVCLTFVHIRPSFWRDSDLTYWRCQITITFRRHSRFRCDQMVYPWRARHETAEN